MLGPGELAPAAISDWLAAGGAGAPRARAAEVDMRGLARLPGLLDDLVAGERRHRRAPPRRPAALPADPARRPARTGSVSA